MSNINIEIPEDLHDDLRIIKVKRKKDINILIIQAINEFVKKIKKENGRI